MFKRMSILLRRAEDTRETFAQKWERHGGFVSQLPLIQSYLQNHVIEQFNHGNGPEADGIVELRFHKPDDMTSAFADPRAGAVKEDEPGFLGHGTGYALGNDSPSLASPQGAKLILVIAAPSDKQWIANVLGHAASSRGFRAGCRDDVKTIIPRPEMERGPQQVSTFLHLLFDGFEAASDAGRELASITPAAAASVFRVRTVSAIPPT